MILDHGLFILSLFILILIETLDGSAYDYCDYAKKNIESKDLFEAFARIQCPVNVQKQTFNLRNRTLPTLGKIYQKIMEVIFQINEQELSEIKFLEKSYEFLFENYQGGFDLNATYVNSKTGQVYGCVHAVFDVKLKN